MSRLVPRSSSLSYDRRHIKPKYFIHNVRGEPQLRLSTNFDNIPRRDNLPDDDTLDSIVEYFKTQIEISNDTIIKFDSSFRPTQQVFDRIISTGIISTGSSFRSTQQIRYRIKMFANKQSDIQKERSFIQSLERDQKLGEMGKKFADLLREMSRTFRQSSIPFRLPSIYVDEEEDDIECLWDNKMYRLLLNIDRSTYDVIAILRVRGARREYVAEFESDIDKIIGQIKGAIQSST